MINNALRDEIGALNASKGWYDNGKRSIAVHCNLLHTEVTEAFEDYRNNKEIDEVWYEYEDEQGDIFTLGIKEFHGVLGKPCGIPSELADVVIRALDMAYEYDEEINLGSIEIDLNIYTNEPFEVLIAELHNLISHMFYTDEFHTINDIISFCSFIANRYNINLEQQIRDKIEYNKTRPNRHGGKRL